MKVSLNSVANVFQNVSFFSKQNIFIKSREILQSFTAFPKWLNNSIYIYLRKPCIEITIIENLYLNISEFPSGALLYGSLRRKPGLRFTAGFTCGCFLFFLVPRLSVKWGGQIQRLRYIFCRKRVIEIVKHIRVCT